MKEPWSLKAGAAWGACIGLAMVVIQSGPVLFGAGAEGVARLAGVAIGGAVAGAALGMAAVLVRNALAR